MKTPQYIFIHHTAVSWQKNPDQWKATNEYHKNKNWGTAAKPLWTPISSLGFYGGYNYEVAANGSVHQFRKDGEVTVAQYQKDMNDGRAISICLDGEFDSELPTEEQKKAVAELLQIKMKAYNIPITNVFCHRHVAPKTCPGSKLPDDIYHYFVPMNPNPLPSDWAKQAWQWLIDQGIIQPNSNPQDTVTKEWIGVVLYRLLKK